MPPSVMPANTTVTITASTTSPVVSTTYTLTLGNPMPGINGTSPQQAVEGGTVPITISGSAFVPGTVILVNGAAVSTTYQSANVVVAQIPGPAGSTANLSVKAKNPAPLGGTSASFPAPCRDSADDRHRPGRDEYGQCAAGDPGELHNRRYGCAVFDQTVDSARRWNPHKLAGRTWAAQPTRRHKRCLRIRR